MSHEYPYSIKRHGTSLETCDEEPVHTPGCIQSHGALLVLRAGDLTIVQASENSFEWLGCHPGELLGTNVAPAIGEAATDKIRKALERGSREKTPYYVTTIQPGTRKICRVLNVGLHTCLSLVILELEAALEPDPPLPGESGFDPDYYGLVRRTLTLFQDARSLDGLSRSIAEEVHRITGFDRVMIYRFHEDESGEIVAECKRSDQVSWLGWRYPAHDIPRPAREIFKKIWSRPVPDVRSALFEMVPLLNPETGKPLDMTYCSLRGVSVMYTEYLDNMGVRAALTLPLVCEGELWGLVACHHDSPKNISYRVRAAAEFLARGASQQLLRAAEREHAEYRVSLESANYALISKVALELELSAFTDGPIHLGAGMDCDGAAIFYQENWHLVGKTPAIPQLSGLSQWLLTSGRFEGGPIDFIFSTDRLPELYPEARQFAKYGSGLLAFIFSRQPLGLVFYFKVEALQTLTWAGNPNELPVLGGVHGARLSPRKSFEIWRETVSHHSMPWKKVELESSSKLRGLIIDMLVSRAEQLNLLKGKVAERTREVEESRERLSAILDTSLDGVVVYEAIRDDGAALRDLRLILLNPAAERQMGRNSAAVINRTLLEISPEAFPTGLFEQFEQIIEQDVALDFEYKSTATSPPRWYRIAGAKLADGLALSYSDITARKSYEAELAYERDQVRALLDSIPDAIYFKDRDSRFVLVSRSKVKNALVHVPDLAARRASHHLPTDVPEAEILNGLSDRDTYDGEDARRTGENERQIVQTGEPMIGKLERQVFLSGTVRWVLTSKMPWRDREGNIIGTFGISKDITDLKEAELKLDGMQRRLVEASRLAGMAEVATGVLHNVGNVLNSVNVSATLVANLVRHSKGANIAKLAALLKEHVSDLAGFLTQDSRGRLIPSYLETLAESLVAEQRSLLDEIEHLRKNIDHIKEIVAMQQAHARTAGITETISVSEMIEDALRINAGMLDGHEVLTIRDFQVQPTIVTDKHKVMQILINLVCNAKLACVESGLVRKQITVRTTSDERNVSIAIIDNGIGIAAENLVRIFNHGFTTRKDGHGFGLHSGALAAAEIGGSLRVQSDGVGRGATFVLTLPLALEAAPT